MFDNIISVRHANVHYIYVTYVRVIGIELQMILSPQHGLKSQSILSSVSL